MVGDNQPFQISHVPQLNRGGPQSAASDCQNIEIIHSEKTLGQLYARVLVNDQNSKVRQISN